MHSNATVASPSRNMDPTLESAMSAKKPFAKHAWYTAVAAAILYVTRVRSIVKDAMIRSVTSVVWIATTAMNSFVKTAFSTPARLWMRMVSVLIALTTSSTLMNCDKLKRGAGCCLLN